MMKRLMILAVCLVAASVMAAGWNGSFYLASGSSDDGVGLGYKASSITVYAPDSNFAVVYFADGDTVVPRDSEPGESDAEITYPAGVPCNEVGVYADSLYINRTGTTEVFIYWR